MSQIGILSQMRLFQVTPWNQRLLLERMTKSTKSQFAAKLKIINDSIVKYVINTVSDISAAVLQENITIDQK